jgi:hypothetical protein
MRADFSRLRFERRKHYTSVLQQQGRVALDADHNEQCAIDENLRGIENTDIIGPFGGPNDDAGFAITIDGDTINIGAGRYYVHGVLCESEAKVDYGFQPYLIQPTRTGPELLTDLSRGSIGSIRLFLEVWKRLVTALDDASLREPALGQADTTTRLQTVWRVVALTAPPPPTLTGTIQLPTNLKATTREQQVAIQRAGLLVAGNFIKTGSGAAAPAAASTGTASAAPAATGGAATSAATAASPAAIPESGCCGEMYAPGIPRAPGTLSAQTAGGSSDCSCQPTPAAGYRGLENQLYRVEVHQAGAAGAATFKWSRENGSVVAAVTGVAGADVTVDSLGPDANLGFQVGQWVEIGDDANLFGPIPNQPGALFKIKSITPETNAITLDGPVPKVDPSRNARLRRWDQAGVSATSAGVPVSVDGWVDLENGIQVRFAGGQFQSGDYWLIPARTATGRIEWPPSDSDGAQFRPPRRVDVIRAPLACIHLDEKQNIVVDDCRRFFPPLAEVAGGAISALHVTKISWSNDDVLPFDQLIVNGLTLTFDQAPTSRIDSSIFTLVLEVPVVSPLEAAAVQTGYAPIVFRKIPFQGPSNEGGLLQLEALFLMNAMLLQGTPYSAFARARIKLLGRKTYSDSGSGRFFLDGQTFGAPAMRADGVTPRTDLTLPSGAAEMAGDFESWFFLAPMLLLLSVTVQPAAVIFTPTGPAPANPVATLTTNYPALVDTVVGLSVISPAGVTAGASVQATVLIPKGENSATFPVRVQNTKNAAAQNFQIVATVTLAGGTPASVGAILTITGFAPPSA